jgi:hypothetical protein
VPRRDAHDQALQPLAFHQRRPALAALAEVGRRLERQVALGLVALWHAVQLARRIGSTSFAKSTGSARVTSAISIAPAGFSSPAAAKLTMTTAHARAAATTIPRRASGT